MNRVMRRLLRIVVITASAALAVAVALAALWLVFSRRPFPKTAGTIELEGPETSIDVIRDSDGIPHIYAGSPEDLFFAQGFVHAQDRFWQMELWRRLGAGRIAELFGEKQKNLDIFMRTMGFSEVARREYERMNEETRRFVDSYAAGVNAYIDDRGPARSGLEFALLELRGVDVEIEPWSPVHTLTWAKVMAYDLCGNMDTERLVLEVVRAAGAGGLRDIFAPYREDMPVVVSDEELWAAAGAWTAGGSTPTGGAPRLPLVLGGARGIGSNGWVISGRLTATGTPLFANDQHLSVQMPSIWYQVGLHCPAREEGEGEAAAGGQGGAADAEDSLNARGFSFPGVPGVIAGHNGGIAWGFTNAYADVQDLYLERINPEDPDQYEVNGEWVDMELIREEIEIQGRDEPHVLLVRKTRHGPILSGVEAYRALESYRVSPVGEFPENLELYAVSLGWTAFEPGELLRSVFDLNRARNFDDFREALRRWDAPSQNVLYADVDGNIGCQLAGFVPIRACGLGGAPVPGWTDEFGWEGRIPFDELPSLYNPEKGFIVTANNPIAGGRYPYNLGTEFAYGFRARRITDLIEEDADGISVDDVKTMQADTLHMTALEIVPYLEGLVLEPPEPPPGEREAETGKEREELEAMERARDRLLEWDGRMDRDAVQPALYNFFWTALVKETLEDQYPESRWPPQDQGRLRNIFHYLLQQPGNRLWDDTRTLDERETRDDILARAFRRGYREGKERLGDTLDAWTWGEVHGITFRNQTLGRSGIALIERIFNRGPFPMDGDASVVNAAGWDAEDPFEVNHTVSMRVIVDMGDPGSSLMMHAPGQSGHPGHRHYADLIDPWLAVRYIPGRWDRSAVERDAGRRLTLKPASAK